MQYKAISWEKIFLDITRDVKTWLWEFEDLSYVLSFIVTTFILQIS